MTTLLSLSNQHCQALRGAEHRIADDSLQAHLGVLDGWNLVENDSAIRKTFRFKNYYATLAFVNALAYVAHREDHHPDLGVHYDRCVVTYSTHDVGGLSQNDFICAAKAQRLAEDAAN
jgi:4a-hydroxytetrahydrobiopterin dehydratase